YSIENLANLAPPLEEQQAIAAFLDRETGKIDTLIAEQQRLVELLAEKRQAVISHAVTKGLNPNAPMKKSGIEWLGEVPAHWGCMPMKYLVRLRSGGTPSKERHDYWDGSIPWASGKDMKVETLSDTEDHITELAIEQGSATLIEQDAVLVVVRGMILARTFPVALTDERMAINQDLKAVLAGTKLQPAFLAWYLRGTADESLRRLDEAAHGTKALRMEAWTSMEIALPSLDEQAAIANLLGRTTSQLDTLTAEANRAIALLQERRSALISAAVTGKIDVRGQV
ncbi:MAG: restriction endonuclease subunit S, partial [Sulfurimicrobium sp.]|nr:restriction endonuclease subunit S [Sulfurimicrobium sp.]